MAANAVDVSCVLRRSSFALVCVAAGVARAEVDLANVRDIEALSLAELLERPTITASRYAQRPGDSPMIVSSVDADQIDALGYRTLGDVLHSMRGVYSGNDRNYSYLGSRGFAIPGDYNTRFALAIDGHRINDVVYGQAATGLELGLPLIAIERVELLRGGAWSVYGQNALLGAIQVVTATGASRPGLRVRSTHNVTAETYGDRADRDAIAPRAQDISASYGYAEDGVDLFAAASYLVDRGLSSLYMPELASAEGCVDRDGRERPCDGIVVGGDKEEVASAYMALRTKSFKVHSLAAQRRKLVPTGSFETLIGVPTETIDTRIYGDATFSRSHVRSDIDARVALDYYDYRGNYPYDGYFNRDTGTGLWATGELRGRYKWKRLGRYLSHVEIAAGAEAQMQQGRQHNTDEYPKGSELWLDRTDHARTFAINAHAIGRAFDRVVTFGAIRGDYYPDSFGLRINPQIGFVLDLEEHGRIRASQVYGFRAPTLYELSWSTAEVHTQSDLDPEHSQTRELSFERYIGKHARLIAVGYVQEFRDLIAYTTDEDGVQRYVNHDGRAKSYGAEFELEARWPSLQLRTSYAYQRAVDENDDPRVNSPRSLAVMTALVPVGENALLAAETTYIGARSTLVGPKIAPLFTTTLSLTLRDITDGIDLAVGVRNAFDARVTYPGSEEHRQSAIPGDPRTIWLQLTGRIGGDR